MKNTSSIITTTTLMLLPTFMMAADSTTDVVLSWAFNNVVLVIALLVLVGVGLTMFNLMNTMVDHQKKEMLRAQGIEVSTGASGADDTNIFQRLYDAAWDLVPMNKEQEIDLGHDYDGIRELDNRLPPWWVYTFYFTIAWAAAYLYVGHFSDIGVSQQEEYAIEVEEAEKAKLAYLATQGSSVDETNVTLMTGDEDLADGKTIFMTNCVACHGAEGQGGVGPNLTDQYWIHGGGIQNIFKVIKYGVPEKGMIAWSSQLKPTSMQKVASYIASLEGTNPPNPKEPQGDLWEGDVVEVDVE